MKKLINAFTSLFISSLCFGLSSCSNQPINEGSWATDVKTGLNAFILDKGKKSSSHQGNEYAVFDFDNTSAIFDVEEQLMIYELEHMSFSFSPNQIEGILSSGVPDLKRDLSEFGYAGKTYEDWICDIKTSYDSLYSEYGPFDNLGIQDDSTLSKLHSEDAYKEFSTKMPALYSLIGDAESSLVSYPWVTYWFTGKSEEEVYQLAKASNSYYQNVESEALSWDSPAIPSKIGQVSYNFINGVSVTKEVNDLMHVLNENDIKVWICSASEINVVRAAVDVFGLHDAISGVIGMTDKVVDGRISNQYDYETGYAYLIGGDSWKKDNLASKVQTVGEGKVKAIQNILLPKYGHGPNAGFMDSTGDFNFCSEFKDLSLVTCFNRANRKVTEGGGLIAETAIYQKEALDYDYKKAKENGDTYYLLQGRDENGLRSLRKSNKTIRLGENEEKLFANKDNETMLNYFKKEKLSTKEILNTYSIKNTSKDKFDFAYGFLSQYDGYHSK